MTSENFINIRSFVLELQQKSKSILLNPILRKNSRFYLISLLSFPALLKTIGNFKNDLPNAPTRFIFPSNKILKFKIETFFYYLSCTQTQKKKN